MDPKFRPVYARLYGEFERDWAPGQFDQELVVGRVREAIARTQDQLRAQGLPPLREDAVYLLLVNYVTMIYRPLLLTAREEISLGQIDELMRADVSTIMRESAIATMQRQSANDGVSAHAVLNTLPNIWSRLRSGATRVWEGEES